MRLQLGQEPRGEVDALIERHQRRQDERSGRQTDVHGSQQRIHEGKRRRVRRRVHGPARRGKPAARPVGLRVEEALDVELDLRFGARRSHRNTQVAVVDELHEIPRAAVRVRPDRAERALVAAVHHALQRRAADRRRWGGAHRVHESRRLLTAADPLHDERVAGVRRVAVAAVHVGEVVAEGAALVTQAAAQLRQEQRAAAGVLVAQRRTHQHPVALLGAQQEVAETGAHVAPSAVRFDRVQHLPDVLEPDEQVADDLHPVGARDARQQLGRDRGLDEKRVRRQRAPGPMRLDDVGRQQHRDLVAADRAPHAVGGRDDAEPVGVRICREAGIGARGGGVRGQQVHRLDDLRIGNPEGDGGKRAVAGRLLGHQTEVRAGALQHIAHRVEAGAVQRRVRNHGTPGRLVGAAERTSEIRLHVPRVQGGVPPSDASGGHRRIEVAAESVGCRHRIDRIHRRRQFGILGWHRLTAACHVHLGAVVVRVVVRCRDIEAAVRREVADRKRQFRRREEVIAVAGYREHLDTVGGVHGARQSSEVARTEAEQRVRARRVVEPAQVAEHADVEGHHDAQWCPRKPPPQVRHVPLRRGDHGVGVHAVRPNPHRAASPAGTERHDAVERIEQQEPLAARRETLQLGTIGGVPRIGPPRTQRLHRAVAVGGGRRNPLESRGQLLQVHRRTSAGRRALRAR